MNIFRKKMSHKSDSVYLDYAAATPVDPLVLDAMEPFWREHFGNAGSFHKEGRYAKDAITNARKICAKSIGAKEDEVVFTGSGTESNNLATFGVIGTLLNNEKELKDIHVITSSIEHPSILDCFYVLKAKGAEVTFLGVNEEGIISASELKQAIKENTALVSLMYVNNETGVIQPIEEFGKIIKNSSKGEKPIYHVDASQAGLYIDIDVKKLHVDLMTLDGQKMYGPKGVGLLYRKEGLVIQPIMFGGTQEFNMRPSTPNTPAIVGFGKAYELAEERREEEVKRLRILQAHTIDRILNEIPDAILNGSREERIPSNVNVSIPGLDAEFVQVALSEKGFYVGTRSACIGEAGGPSFVLVAMGRRELATSSLRFSFGVTTTKENIDALIDALKEIVERQKENPSD